MADPRTGLQCPRREPRILREMLEAGTAFDHRYQIQRVLGRGAMATVYLARHTGLLSYHAIKVLEPRFAEVPDLRARFLAEGRIQANFRHPHIVAVTDIVADPVPGLVLEFVDGPDLHTYAKRNGPFTLEQLQALMLPILDAVGAAHQVGVVHRDLKPENVLIPTGPEGGPHPKVADFGIAKILDAGAGFGGRAPTRDGTRLGTLLYMSPEQVRAQPVDHRSDIFSLGAVLYELATARVAFDAPSEFDTMERILVGAFEPPERVVGGLAPGLAACIRVALAVDAAERFQTCDAFADALRGAGDPSVAHPPRPTRSFAVTKVTPPDEPILPAATEVDRATIGFFSEPVKTPPPTPVMELPPPPVWELPPELPAVVRPQLAASMVGLRLLGALWLVTALTDMTFGLIGAFLLLTAAGLLCGLPFGGWLAFLLLPLGVLQVVSGAWLLFDPRGMPWWLAQLTALGSLLSPCLGGVTSWVPAIGTLLASRSAGRA